MYSKSKKKMLPHREKYVCKSLSSNCQWHHFPNFTEKKEWRLQNKTIQCCNFGPKQISYWDNNQVRSHAKCNAKRFESNHYLAGRSEFSKAFIYAQY